MVLALVCSSLLLGLPCFFTRRLDLVVLSGTTSLISVLYWSGVVPRYLDLCSARICAIYYVYLNFYSQKYRLYGFVCVGIFCIFYVLSCLTNLIWIHVLFHVFAMCAKFCVVMEPNKKYIHSSIK